MLNDDSTNYRIQSKPKEAVVSPIVRTDGPVALDSGYIYAPYIPLCVTPTVPANAVDEKTPLESLVEGIFAEEIEAGELQKCRPHKPAELDGYINRCRRHRRLLVNPSFLGKVSISDL